MRKFITRFSSDTRGATAIEYGLIATLIAVGIISSASTIGKTASNTFGKIANNVSSTK